MEFTLLLTLSLIALMVVITIQTYIEKNKVNVSKKKMGWLIVVMFVSMATFIVCVTQLVVNPIKESVDADIQREKEMKENLENIIAEDLGLKMEDVIVEQSQDYLTKEYVFEIYADDELKKIIKKDAVD